MSPRNVIPLPEDELWRRIEEMIGQLKPTKEHPVFSDVITLGTQLYPDAWHKHDFSEGSEAVSFGPTMMVVRLEPEIGVPSFVEVGFEKTKQGDWYFSADLYCHMYPEAEYGAVHVAGVLLHYLVSNKTPRGHLSFPERKRDFVAPGLEDFIAAIRATESFIDQFYKPLIQPPNRE